MCQDMSHTIKLVIWEQKLAAALVGSIVMSDLLGWIGTSVMALGSIDIAHMRVRGLWLMLLGNVFWASAGVYSGMSSLVGVSVLMGGLDIYAIHKWSEKIE